MDFMVSLGVVRIYTKVLKYIDYQAIYLKSAITTYIRLQKSFTFEDNCRKFSK